MAILHGSWIPQRNSGHLFIWGEIWRTTASLGSSSSKGVPDHPFAMIQTELTSFLRFHNLDLDSFIEESRESRQGRSNDVKQKQQQNWQANVVVLPTQTASNEVVYPLLSTRSLLESTDDTSRELQPWNVQGWELTPLETINFLQALPLSSFKASDTYVGGDLRFWSQVMRWSLDLLSRCKFLPGVYRQPNGEII
ncbi:MAG TPA: ATP-dependent helicase, partial [Coleofasciculaceae cyanobacterium]